MTGSPGSPGPDGKTGPAVSAHTILQNVTTNHHLHIHSMPIVYIIISMKTLAEMIYYSTVKNALTAYPEIHTEWVTFKLTGLVLFLTGFFWTRWPPWTTWPRWSQRTAWCHGIPWT